MMKEKTERGFRVCTICRKTLPLNLEHFYSVTTPGFKGLSYLCRVCNNTKRKKTKLRVLSNRRRAMTYVHKNPDKMAARALTRKAIKDGQLTKMSCEVCGFEKSEAHHDDYSKPLDIRWLCKKHHTEHHFKKTQ